MAAPRYDILGLGGVAVDDFIYVDAYPPPDAKARVVRRERHCGGLTATALVAAARLGARCAYAGVLGKDELSQFAAGCLEREGIDVSRLRRVATARPIYSNIVVDRQHNTRNIFFDLDHVEGAGRGVASAVVAGCRVLFVDNLGVGGMVRAARVARKAGIPVVGDFENDRDPQFAELLGLTDHLILSRDFAQVLTGKASAEKAVRELACAGRQVAVVTQGSEGCWYMVPGWPAPKHQPAFAVKVVDTTGCGDVFHGAYAFGLARGQALDERIRFAAATAALKAAATGGQGAPSLAAVRKLVANGEA
jgi:sulfofructose kinase